jgi:hypothetical protein
MKKKFKDTKIGIFLKQKAPAILDKVGDFLPDKGGLGILKNIISKDETLSETDKAEAIELLNHELEMYRIDATDRASAREREKEYVRNNRTDWMMISTGSVALLSFILLVCAVLFYPNTYADNSIVMHLMGIIEGVTLTMFMYYYGSSKGSKDKTSLLNQK